MIDNEKNKLLSSIKISTLLIVLMWGSHILSFLTGFDAYHYGIFPREISGLIGIVLAPFIHGSWEHLISNTIPLWVLMSSLGYFYNKISIKVLLGIYFIAGIWIWIMARPSYHIGASGVVYGLAFFLFFSGVFRKDLPSISIALCVCLLYGGMVWGMFPIEEGVSWESHLLGGAAGALLAFFFRKQQVHAPKKYYWELNDTEDNAGAWNYKDRIPPPEGWNHPD